jgi:UDP-glucose 4-epimerase
MAETVLRLTDSSSHIEWVPARAGDYAGREVSAEHVAQVLGWRPTTGFEQGVQNYLDWLASEPTRKPTPAA